MNQRHSTEVNDLPARSTGLIRLALRSASVGVLIGAIVLTVVLVSRPDPTPATPGVMPGGASVVDEATVEVIDPRDLPDEQQAGLQTFVDCLNAELSGNGGVQLIEHGQGDSDEYEQLRAEAQSNCAALLAAGG
jgi:hypothetical protein